MIISIWSHIKDIVTLLDSMTNITDVLPWWVWFEKPTEKEETYMFISLTSDNIDTQSNVWWLIKTARLSFHIVWGTQDVLPDTLYSIVDTITNEIVTEQCLKIGVNNLKLVNVDEGTISPIFTIEKNKPYIIKDYFFTYYAK